MSTQSGTVVDRRGIRARFPLTLLVLALTVVVIAVVFVVGVTLLLGATWVAVTLPALLAILLVAALGVGWRSWRP